MKATIRTAVWAATMGVLAASGSAACAAATLPPVHRAGGVEFLSGGIGKDEATALEKAAPRWPLTLEFAVKDQHRADFAADVQVVVRDAKGHAALRTRADGPFLLARLAPGPYEVEARLDGKTLREKVVVKDGAPARALLLWPAEPAAMRS
jgi:hypothetical protein